MLIGRVVAWVTLLVSLVGVVPRSATAATITVGRVADINPGRPSSVEYSNLVIVNGTLFFATDDGTSIHTHVAGSAASGVSPDPIGVGTITMCNLIGMVNYRWHRLSFTVRDAMATNAP